MLRSESRNSRQEPMKHTALRNADYWFVLFVFLYNAGPPTKGCNHLQWASLPIKIPHRLGYRLIWWRHLFIFQLRILLLRFDPRLYQAHKRTDRHGDYSRPVRALAPVPFSIGNCFTSCWDNQQPALAAQRSPKPVLRWRVWTVWWLVLVVWMARKLVKHTLGSVCLDVSRDVGYQTEWRSFIWNTDDIIQ